MNLFLFTFVLITRNAHRNFSAIIYYIICLFLYSSHKGHYVMKNVLNVYCDFVHKIYLKMFLVQEVFSKMLQTFFGHFMRFVFV
jgi:hypothetical protein